jgi:hypothetical protein
MTGLFVHNNILSMGNYGYFMDDKRPMSSLVKVLEKMCPDDLQHYF